LHCYLIGSLFLNFSERRLGMLNGPKDGLERRDFMTLALGSVGATAAASVNADAAMARDAAVSSAAPGTGAQQGTVYTGDQGRRFEFLCIIQVKGFGNTGDRPFDIDAALE
jgi:hypothetical protein